MRDARHVLALEWAKLGRPPLSARTGINSGPMLVGNYGSKYRFNYSVLGDSVNLASRLEQLNKVYRTDIMIGEQTADLIGSTFRLRELDKVQVMGRTQALQIYELLGVADAVLPPAREQMLVRYAAALKAYRGRRWDEASELFRQCLDLCPDDGPSAVMGERCRMMRDKSLPENWDGAFEHLVKA
jgi:adenylate cyclase